MTDELTLLSKRIKDIEAFSWDEAVSVGLQLRHIKELSQWAIGDLARKVSVDFGDDSIGKFAYAIGLERTTVREYMRVAEKYQPTIRMAVLSFRHHQIALQADDPVEALTTANDNNWSTRQLYKAVKEQTNHHPPHDHHWVTYRKCLDCGKVEPIDLETSPNPSLSTTSTSDQSFSSQVNRAFLAIRKPF